MPPPRATLVIRSLGVLALICCAAYSLLSHAATSPETVFPPEAELIILLDSKSPQKFADTPEDVLRSVASTSKTPSEQTIFVALGSPLKARYGVSERLNAEQLRLVGADSARARLDHFVVLSYADTATAERNHVALTANKGIANVTKNIRYHFSVTPSDPGWQSGPFGTGFMNYQWGLQQMNFPAAWETVKGNAYVAVLDTGIMLGHPDLTANFRPQLSQILTSVAQTLDDEIPAPPPEGRGHGTHVAGVIAANSNNGTGVAGGCWNCALLIGKTTSSGTYSSVQTVADGIRYAVDSGAQVCCRRPKIDPLIEVMPIQY